MWRDPDVTSRTYINPCPVPFALHRNLTVDVHHQAMNPIYVMTALIRAAQQNDIKTVYLLLGRGASVHTTDKFGWTALHHAACRGCIEAAALLIGAGADPEAKAIVEGMSQGGARPLDIAALYGHHGFIRFLVKLGADMNAESSDDRTPEDYAKEGMTLVGTIFLVNANCMPSGPTKQKPT
jgi:ankyrin repeat protein